MDDSTSENIKYKKCNEQAEDKMPHVVLSGTHIGATSTEAHFVEQSDIEKNDEKKREAEGGENREEDKEEAEHLHVATISNEPQMHTATTSHITEHVRQYVRQYERANIVNVELDEMEVIEPFETRKYAKGSKDEEQSIQNTVVGPQIEHDNELVKRFHNIMQMFDNFTKNLESLEMERCSTKTNQLPYQHVYKNNRCPDNPESEASIDHHLLNITDDNEIKSSIRNIEDPKLSPEARLEREIVRRGCVLSTISPEILGLDKDTGAGAGVGAEIMVEEETMTEPRTDSLTETAINLEAVLDQDDDKFIVQKKYAIIFEPQIEEKSTNIKIKNTDVEPHILIPPPCERTYHTIHIDTTSSPSSSVMRRPPLCRRCWEIITGFFNAILLCMQLNKDCILCIGFFVAFLVSASFLTAFFYETLISTPKYMQTQYSQAGIHHVPNPISGIHQIAQDSGQILFLD